MGYISKNKRKEIKNKYNGLCAYSGTKLEDDWEIDHIKPKMYFNIGLENGDPNHVDNLVPTQKLINHYKRGLDLETFRNERLGKMHLKLAKLPKKPRTEKSKKRIKYMRTIANYFGITETEPFSKIFHFEKINNEENKNK